MDRLIAKCILMLLFGACLPQLGERPLYIPEYDSGTSSNMADAGENSPVMPAEDAGTHPPSSIDAGTQNALDSGALHEMADSGMLILADSGPCSHDNCRDSGPCLDSDSDLICDETDNCPEIENSEQEDTDSDGTGDACNSADDLDGDEWGNDTDNCDFVYNASQADSDNDGIGDACDDDIVILDSGVDPPDTSDSPDSGINSGTRSDNQTSLDFALNQQILVPHHDNLKFETGFTWSIWLKPTTTSSEQVVMSKSRGNSGTGLVLRAGTENTNVHWCGPDGCGSVCPEVNAPGLTVDQWSHLAATWTGNTVAIYVNGEEKNSANCTAIPGSINETPFMIGREWVGSAGFRSFEGHIYEVAVWQEALDASEITTLSTGLIPSNPEGLWALDEGTGQTANDSSGNDHHGAITGAMWADETPNIVTSNICGDHLISFGETCDDGNTTTETECDYGTQNCILCNADCSAELSLTGPYCGDNNTDNDEECDDGENENGDGCSASCTNENTSSPLSCQGDQCVYTDPTTGYVWQGCLAGQSGSECTGTTLTKNFSEAITYCDDLSWGGHHDWQLPDIDVLRTLVRDCHVTISNGTCDITHQCSPNIAGAASCSTPQCVGCDNNAGPSPGGCYIPSELPGTPCAETLWSSSKLNDSLSYYLWTGAAHVDAANNSYPYPMRCVRQP